MTVLPSEKRKKGIAAAQPFSSPPLAGPASHRHHGGPHHSALIPSASSPAPLPLVLHLFAFHSPPRSLARSLSLLSSLIPPTPSRERRAGKTSS